MRKPFLDVGNCLFSLTSFCLALTFGISPARSDNQEDWLYRIMVVGNLEYARECSVITSYFAREIENNSDYSVEYLKSENNSIYGFEARQRENGSQVITLCNRKISDEETDVWLIFHVTSTQRSVLDSTIELIDAIATPLNISTATD
jgi:hypothetical protein